MYNTLQYDLTNGVATVTLNRPDRYNAIDNELSKELIKCWKDVAKNPEVRVVVLTGAGEKAFCSGQDLKDVAGVERNLGDSVRKRYNPMTRPILQTEKPFICRLNGIAAGAGAGLALACDMVVAAEHAQFLFAFANIGLVMDSGSSYTLPRLVGRRKAFEMATRGHRIGMEEALKRDMVNQVVPADQLDTAVNELAAEYARKAPLSIGLIKRMLQRSPDSDLDTMLNMEAYCQEIAGNSGDYIEGVTAWMEKREPNFQGK